MINRRDLLLGIAVTPLVGLQPEHSLVPSNEALCEALQMDLDAGLLPYSEPPIICWVYQLEISDGVPLKITRIELGHDGAVPTWEYVLGNEGNAGAG